jgi:hypothetical protein
VRPRKEREEWREWPWAGNGRRPGDGERGGGLWAPRAENHPFSLVLFSPLLFFVLIIPETEAHPLPCTVFSLLVPYKKHPLKAKKTRIVSCCKTMSLEDQGEKKLLRIV